MQPLSPARPTFGPVSTRYRLTEYDALGHARAEAARQQTATEKMQAAWQLVYKWLAIAVAGFVLCLLVAVALEKRGWLPKPVPPAPPRLAAALPDTLAAAPVPAEPAEFGTTAHGSSGQNGMKPFYGDTSE